MNKINQGISQATSAVEKATTPIKSAINESSGYLSMAMEAAKDCTSSVSDIVKCINNGCTGIQQELCGFVNDTKQYIKSNEIDKVLNIVNDFTKNASDKVNQTTDLTVRAQNKFNELLAGNIGDNLYVNNAYNMVKKDEIDNKINTIKEGFVNCYDFCNTLANQIPDDIKTNSIFFSW